MYFKLNKFNTTDMKKEEYYFLGCEAIQSSSLPIFRRKVLPPSPGSKSKLIKQDASSKQSAILATCLSGFPSILKISYYVPPK
jgi:hypothetical protein